MPNPFSRLFDRGSKPTPHVDPPRETNPGGPTISAELKDGPAKGTSIDVAVVEGRPPKTIDVPVGEGETVRYALADWMQSGESAVYTFLYEV